MENLPPFNMADVFALVVLAVNVFIGLRRGLSGDLAQLVGTVAAFYVGWRFHGPLAERLSVSTRVTGQAAQALAYVATLLCAVAALVLLRFVLKRIIRVVVEPGVDKLLGCVSGFVRGVLIVGIIFLLMNLLPNAFLNRVFGTESVVGTLLLRNVASLRERLEKQEPATEPPAADPAAVPAAQSAR